MEYTKEMLIDEAIKKLNNIDDLLKDCMELISGAHAEREVARYLLFLGCEKKDK